MAVKERVFTLKDAEEWKSLLNNETWVANDVFFLPEWYRTWEEGGCGGARGLYYEIDDVKFFYPFLFHRIDGYDLPGTFYDAESAYSSGGALVNHKADPDTIISFNRAVDKWMQNAGVIAEFIRLHPGLNNYKVRQANYLPVRNDLYLDIDGLTEEKIWDEILSGKTRNMVRKGQKEGMSPRYQQTIGHNYDQFIRIYRESVKRLQMQPFYDFSDTYFLAFKRYLGSIASQLDVMHGDDIIASSLWLKYRDVLHYYLGATADNFNSLPSSNFYLWEIIKMMLKDNTIKTIHWGGGMSLDPEDPLFKFKEKYSNRSVTVHIGKIVHNMPVYQSLCAQWEKRYPILIAQHSNKLLRYREKV